MAITKTDLLTHPTFNSGIFPAPTLTDDPVLDATELEVVVEKNVRSKILAYIRSGKDVHVINAQGKTLLWLACRFFPEMVPLILKGYPKYRKN